MTTPPPPSNHPHLIILGELRGRITAGYLYRQTVTDDETRWNQAAARWNRLTAAYLAELRQAVEGMTRAELTAARDELVSRLERGWTLVESQEVTEQFLALLSRYEAVRDALSGVAAATHRLNDLDRNVTLAWVLVSQERAARQAPAPGRRR